MNDRFLQIHTLTSFPGSLLNRDDVGFAKRLPFGGHERVRISSQCLKRHWRRADDENALDRLELPDGSVPMSVRSRRTFEYEIYEPLKEEGVDDEIARAITEEIIETILPEGKGRQARGEDAEEASELRTAQVTVIGRPEVEYLLQLAREVAAEAGNAKATRKAWKERDKKELKKNLQTLARGAGLDAALFGRMVTGDILARCDAAIHVAHAFTVHSGFFETDYFSAVDDLQPAEETGSGHINTSEMTTGVYYGYVVVDVPLLVSNLEGCARGEWLQADRTLAAEVVRRLVHLIATVSPGAKLGATAPYAHALTVVAESGNAQPRTLANAFLQPVDHRGDLLQRAQQLLAGHLASLDAMYERKTARAVAAVNLESLGESEPSLTAVVDHALNLPGLAEWCATRIRGEETEVAA